MIVSHRYRFIFLKTRKTGGTSVEIGLSRFCSPADIITPVTLQDEQLRASLGYPGPRNAAIALRHYETLDWLRLLGKRRRKQYFNHATAEYVRHHIGESIWNSYFKFCFERNPFDKPLVATTGARENRGQASRAIWMTCPCGCFRTGTSTPSTIISLWISSGAMKTSKRI